MRLGKKCTCIDDVVLLIGSRRCCCVSLSFPFPREGLFALGSSLCVCGCRSGSSPLSESISEEVLVLCASNIANKVCGRNKQHSMLGGSKRELLSTEVHSWIHISTCITLLLSPTKFDCTVTRREFRVCISCGFSKVLPFPLPSNFARPVRGLRRAVPLMCVRRTHTYTMHYAIRRCLD